MVIHNAFECLGKSVLACLILHMVGGCGPLFRVAPVDLPVPTGPYPVGTATRHWLDASRHEAFASDPNARRELMVQLWYPAENVRGASSAPYIADLAAVASPVARRMGIFPFMLMGLDRVRTHSFAGVRMATEATGFPVLILSHGLGTSASLHTVLAEELASHGYVVAAINHTYSSMAVRFPDGRIAVDKDQPNPKKSEQSNLNRLAIWAADAQFVLDQLVATHAGDPTGLLTGRLDLTRVGVLGHSFGGATAAEACRRDGRFRAGLNMDGTLYGDVYATGLDQPFMTLKNQERADVPPPPTPREMAALGWTPAQFEAIVQEFRRREQQLKDGFRGGWYDLVIRGAMHNNFNDEPLVLPLLGSMNRTAEEIGPIDPVRCLKIINTYVVAFFDKHLKGEDVPLLTGASTEYPEVRFAAGAPAR